MTYLSSLKVVEGQNFVIPCCNGAKLDGFGYTFCVDIILICNREKKLSHYRLWAVSSKPSLFHFLVHLHINLVSTLVALFTDVVILLYLK